MTTPYDQPVKTVQAGDTVRYETKSPFSTYRFWGLLTLALTFGVNKLVDSGKLPEVFREPVIETGIELLGYGAGFLMTAYGAWTAKRPLGLGGVTEPKQVN